MMAAWEYLVLRSLKAGDRMLLPGELTNIPNAWSHRVLMAHLDTGFIEKARLLEDEEPNLQPYPTGAPEGYDKLKPTPPPRQGNKVRGKGQTWQACWNCLGRNYLAKGMNREIPWQCWYCFQTQTLAERDERWKQQGVADVAHESLLEIHDHPGVRPR
jgi:hypothetical protein